MKSLCLVITALLCLQNAHAQTIVGRWGKVSEEDMLATSYPFAPGAEAIILFDQGEWMPQDLGLGSARLAHHYHIKILTEEGLAQAQRVIRFRKDERISGLRAQVHSMVEGKKKKKLFPVGSLADSTLSTDSLCKVFTFPDVKVGDVLEVRYSLITPSGDVLRPWFFQSRIPTKYSVVTLKAFSPMAFRTKTLPEEFIASSRNKWIRRYSPALPNDAYLINPDDYRLQVRFQLLPFERITEKEEWNDLSYALEVGTVTQVEENVLRAIGSLAYSLTRQAVTEEEKVATIVRHLHKYMNWDGIYSTSVSDDPGTIYRNRKGNSADMNMLLFLLLESAGLSPSRVFVSTRNHGTSIKQPFWGQFNHLVVRVEADGQTFLLDATDNTLDYLWFPLNSANGQGWEISDTATKWVEIPPSQGSLIQHSLDLKLNESGLLTGQVLDRYLGYPESAWAKKMDVSGFMLTPEDPADFAQETQRESPVVLNFPTRDIRIQRPSSDTMVLPLDLFGWQKRLPEIRSDRSLPVHLGFPLEESVSMQVELPEGWKLVDSVGTKLVLFGEGLIMTIKAFQRENSLIISWTYSQDEYVYEPSLNVDLAAFFTEARSRLQSQLILVKE